jgi:hypothetical protein
MNVPDFDGLKLGTSTLDGAISGDVIFGAAILGGAALQRCGKVPGMERALAPEVAP